MSKFKIIICISLSLIFNSTLNLYGQITDNYDEDDDLLISDEDSDSYKDSPTYTSEISIDLTNTNIFSQSQFSSFSSSESNSSSDDEIETYNSQSKKDKQTISDQEQISIKLKDSYDNQKVNENIMKSSEENKILYNQIAGYCIIGFVAYQLYKKINTNYPKNNLAEIKLQMA